MGDSRWLNQEEEFETNVILLLSSLLTRKKGLFTGEKRERRGSRSVDTVNAVFVSDRIRIARHDRLTTLSSTRYFSSCC